MNESILGDSSSAISRKKNAWSLTYPYLIILLCSSFLFYKYVLQIYPSIITESLMREFHLNGAALGNLAATFYYAFMVMQLVVGIMLDKYSTRWITFGAIFCCAVGVYLFSQTTSLFVAELSRGLMGIGVAFATVAYMKLASVWFHPKKYAFVGGFLATAAMAGAVFGEAPLSWLMSDIGWRECLYVVSVAGFILAISFALFVRDEPKIPFQQTTHQAVSFKEIWEVLKSKQNWLLTLYGGLAFSPIAVFGGLWGNPFLQQAYAISKTQSATLVSLTFIGLGIGSPIIGILSNRITNRRKLMFWCTFLSGLCVSLVLYVPNLPLWIVGTALFLFGFLLGAFMLVFTIGKEINKAYLTATVIAMINASDAILDSVTEPLIGKFLDLTWDGKVTHGVHYFSLHSYHWALSILPLYLFLGAITVFWIKEQGQAYLRH